MIGLVIVAHSRALAQALLDLSQQVSVSEVPMAIAAGAGPDRQDFGTDALEIMEAIESVYSDDGVLILMDLGSAVLSAQMAVDLLPSEMQANVRFCAAPIVEGAIAAAVQAGLGSDLETVCREASQALLPKQEQLGIVGKREPEQASAPEAPAGDEKRLILTLQNEHGLHARPAARFVQQAGHFQAEIQVINLTTGRGPVSAKSLNALATLGAIQDHQIEILAHGPEADHALAALKSLVEANFGEKPGPTILDKPVRPKAAAPVAGALQCVPIAEGIAIGRLYRYTVPPPPVPDYVADNPDYEWERLQGALDRVEKAIHVQRRQMAQNLGDEQAAIFDAHLLILTDPELVKLVKSGIFKANQNAAAAWDAAVQSTANQYMGLENEYLKQRAADVLDVGNQVLYALAGESQTEKITFPEPVILLAEELTPTQTAQLDLEQVLGLVTISGGPTSHSAILARSLGIPAVSGAPSSLLAFSQDVTVVIDGLRGAVWVNPDAQLLADLEQRRAAWLAQRQQLLKESEQLALTADGHRIEVVANVGNLQDAQKAIQNGAEGVGLLRTEFLFLTRTEPPTEEDQFEALAQISQVMADLPVVVRTLDVGGDKPLPYIDLPPEANPFLGVRAIRMSLQHPEIFQTQLRAILRAGVHGNLKVMFPMVATYEEVLQARQHLEDAHTALEHAGMAHQWPIETGIMVEIPSAAILAPVLAQSVDFFSIGTNDLTQYTLAAERGNPSLAGMNDALHPAVLHLIQQVVQAAHAHDKWVGVCGELAGDPVAVPVLVGLGVDELSLNSAGIPRIKGILRALKLPDAQRLAEQVLTTGSATDARQVATEFLEKMGLAA
jgi:multiphosphoryl transfer protein